MSEKYNKWEKFYNKLNMVFHGIMALSMLPFAWAFLETQRQFPESPFFEGTPLLIIKVSGAALSVIVMFLSYRYSQNLLNEAKAENSVELKLKNYMSANMKDYLLLEIACAVAFLGLYLTKDHLFTGIYVAVLIMFSFKRPTYIRITKALELTDDDVSDWINEEKEKG
ncbi:MAG: hypothetical protein ACFHWX_06435 [Bacteroidota bacterium]